MSELQEEAAAAITADILSDFGVTGDEAPAEGEPQQPVAQENAPETETTSEESPFDLAALNPDLPEEYAEPDFEAEAEAEIAAETDEEEGEEYLDPQVQEERKRRIAAEKKAAHYEQLQAKERRKSWYEEAKRHAPFAEPFLDEINATSRRGFIREARKIHDKVFTKVKPVLESIAATQKATAKQEAATAWGTPTTGPGAPAAAAAAAQQRVQRARNTGDLAQIIKTRVFGKDADIAI